MGGERIMPKEEDDDFYESVAGMADRMNLEGSERERYIHSHMTRAGYRAVPNYVRDDDDSDDDDFFSSDDRRSQRRRRGRDDDAGGRKRRRDDWFDS
jgi:hypothetical protein